MHPCKSSTPEGYGRALDLLRCNCTPAGILAAAPTRQARERNYTSIFSRDAAICALGMLTSREADLVATARAGIFTLARHQAPNGQIPNFVRPADGEADFWYTGCIDATLWWLIATRYHDHLFPGNPLGPNVVTPIKRALDWLACQEHQRLHLVQQNEASDWADIMPRSGFVLYTNALWYWVKRLFHRPGAEETRRHAAYLFHPFEETTAPDRRAHIMGQYVRDQVQADDLFLSFVNFTFCGDEIDVLGNILAAITGLADPARADRMMEKLLRLNVSDPFPVRVVCKPLQPGHALWRPYMERHRQNLPYQYHNGGIWPFAGGFWVTLLARMGLEKPAHEALARLEAANRANAWEFNEWFHGLDGRPMGMPGQSWNAAMYVLAYRTLADGTPYLFFQHPS